MATTTSKLAGNAVKKNVGAQAPKVTTPPVQTATTAPVEDKTSNIDPKVVSKFLDSVRTTNIEDIVLALVTAGEFDTLTDEAIEEAVQNVNTALGVMSQEYQMKIDSIFKEKEVLFQQLKEEQDKCKKANDRVKILCGIITEM